ncbi:1-aminocyclopropane-1-carboxylate synthase 2, partial [Sesamum angolense]
MELKYENSQVLSKIANTYHGENSPYFSVKQVYDADPFHPTKNPNGIIQMAVAENKAVAKIMKKVRGGKVNYDRIVMAGGVRGAMEMVMFCLADPGDAF